MLGERLMILRKKHGYSQQEIADMLSVSRQTISNWESGQGAPALDKACDLARIYKISLDELAGNESGVSDEKKNSQDLHILESLVGKTCVLDCADLDMITDNAEQDFAGNTKVKILEVSKEWIKIEYVRRKEGTVFSKETVQKLLELSVIRGIALEEE